MRPTQRTPALTLLPFALALLAIGALATRAQAASGTWVGNGDDGSDLEGSTPITEGKIVTARSHAVALLRKLAIEGIPGMGLLIPETESSKLYLSKVDSAAKLESDQGGSHTDIKGRVFARTLAQPHSPTRFFPVAEKLDEDQLVALHVHEALHRALPASVRENESIVSELTLAIVSPEGSHDRVRETAAKLLPPPAESRALAAAPSPYGETPIGSSSSFAVAAAAPDGSLAAKPSLFGYEQRNYWANDEISQFYAVDRVHSIQSFLYPFGGKRNSFGIGLEGSLIQQPSRTIMGPLGLSARLRLWSGRDFDVAAWASAALNMLSADELKNSPFGRDVFTVGVDLRKDLSFFYINNVLSYSSGGSADATIGRIAYNYDYGDVIHAGIHAGASLWIFKLGAYAEVFLADHYRVSGGAWSGDEALDTGRYRMVSAGPEASVRIRDFAISAYGKFLLSAPEDVQFDSLGNLMGPGSGQTTLGARVSVYF
jgi:hypothetical protein